MEQACLPLKYMQGVKSVDAYFLHPVLDFSRGQLAAGYSCRRAVPCEESEADKSCGFPVDLFYHFEIYFNKKGVLL